MDYIKNNRGSYITHEIDITEDVSIHLKLQFETAEDCFLAGVLKDIDGEDYNFCLEVIDGYLYFVDPINSGIYYEELIVNHTYDIVVECVKGGPTYGTFSLYIDNNKVVDEAEYYFAADGDFGDLSKWRLFFTELAEDYPDYYSPPVCSIYEYDYTDANGTHKLIPAKKNNKYGFKLGDTFYSSASAVEFTGSVADNSKKFLAIKRIGNRDRLFYVAKDVTDEETGTTTTKRFVAIREV